MTKTSHFCLTESFLIMKYIYTLFTLLALSFGFSQETLEDFEGASAATDSFGGATASIVDDPESDGTRGKVAQGNSASGGEAWQGYTFNLNTKNLDLTTTKTVTLDVYSDDPGEFAVKVQAGLDGAADSTKNASYSGSGWQTITVDFSSGNVDGTDAADGVYAQIAIYMNWDSSANNFGTALDKTFYIDNFVGVGVDKPAALTPPAAGPEIPPTRAEEDVVSLFGAAYTRHDFGAGGTFDQSWCGAPSIEEVDLDDGQTVVAFKDKDCQGMQFTPVDLTTFTHVSVDIYVDDSVDIIGKTFHLKVVNGDAVEVEINNDLNGLGIAKGEWVTLSSEVDLTAINSAYQFGITSNVNNAVWYTNLYFYKSATAGIENAGLTGIKLYPNPVKSTAAISADQTVQNVQIYDLTGRVVHNASPNKANFNLDVSHLSKGVYLVKVNAGNKEATLKLAK